MEQTKGASRTKTCGACHEKLIVDAFSKKQWQLKPQRRCKKCIEGGNLIICAPPNTNTPMSRLERFGSGKSGKGSKGGGMGKTGCNDNMRSRCTIKEDLVIALRALRRAGGRELDIGADDEENDDGATKYKNELLRVCNLRFELGEYGPKLWGNYFRCYSVAKISYDSTRGKDKSVFEIVHRWSLATLKLDPLDLQNERWIGLTEATVKIVSKLKGCPDRIHDYVYLLHALWTTGTLPTGGQYATSTPPAGKKYVNPDELLTTELLETMPEEEQMQLIHEHLHALVCKFYEGEPSSGPIQEDITDEMFDNALGSTWLERRYELLHLLENHDELKGEVHYSLGSLEANKWRTGSYRTKSSTHPTRGPTSQKLLTAKMLESLSTHEQMQMIRKRLHPLVCKAYKGNSGPSQEDVTEELIYLACGRVDELLPLLEDDDALRAEIHMNLGCMEANWHYKGSYRTRDAAGVN